VVPVGIVKVWWVLVGVLVCPKMEKVHPEIKMKAKRVV
jgi:hypothetical protein